MVRVLVKLIHRAHGKEAIIAIAYLRWQSFEVNSVKERSTTATGRENGVTDRTNNGRIKNA